MYNSPVESTNRKEPPVKRLLALTVLLASAAMAANGLGLGVIVGEPTGLSAKYWLGDRTAVDAAAAWSFWGNYAALNVHADLLVHHPEWLKVPSGELPVYYGIGGRLKLASAGENMRLGARVPLGIEYIFEELPVGLFLETALVVDVIPSVGLWGHGAAGARYYFR
jgi:hypothetical protein